MFFLKSKKIILDRIQTLDKSDYVLSLRFNKNKYACFVLWKIGSCYIYTDYDTRLDIVYESI